MDDKNQSPHGPVSLGIGVGGVLTSTYPPQHPLIAGGVVKEIGSNLEDKHEANTAGGFPQVER